MTKAAAGGVPVKKCAPENFAKLTEKHLCWSPFFNSCWPQACNFIKKETPTQEHPSGCFRDDKNLRLNNRRLTKILRMTKL